MLALLMVAAFILPSTVSRSPSKAQKAGGGVVWVIIIIVGLYVLSGGAHHG